MTERKLTKGEHDRILEDMAKALREGSERVITVREIRSYLECFDADAPVVVEIRKLGAIVSQHNIEEIGEGTASAAGGMKGVIFSVNVG